MLENLEKMNKEATEERETDLEALQKKLEECQIERDALKNEVTRMKTEAEDQKI